jgi:hypothetical protein
MTTFFLDLWQDLRDKRLWPVAVGLVAAVIAIPAIMLKPAAAPSAPPPVASNPSDTVTLPAVSVDTSSTHGSKLATFSTRNPFKPLSDLKDDTTTADTSTSSAGSTSGDGSGSSSASGGSPAGGSSSPGSSPAGGSSGGSGGGAPPTSTDPNSLNSPGIHFYKYTADFQFGLTGSEKTFKSTDALTLLPSKDSPVVVFMGSSDAKSATFFVADPAFRAEGEGKCNSKACTFVTLRLDEGHNEETFTDGNVAYDLKLLKLRRVTMTPEEAKGDAVDSKPSGKRVAAADGGKTISDASGRFLPRLISGPDPSTEPPK